MGQVAACATVNHCCSSAEKGNDVEANAVLRADLPADVRLVAWLRRRSGPDCDFGEVFEELFGTREPVSHTKFTNVLRERGATTTLDAQSALHKIDPDGKGTIGAADLEVWQEGVEQKEVEGLRLWRDWLRKRYATPSAAFHAMGKGEGDVLVENEFTSSLAKLGFDADTVHCPLELFRFVDKDFSGEITFAEFKSAMRSVGVQRVKAKADIKAGRKKWDGTPGQREDSDGSDGDATRAPPPSRSNSNAAANGRRPSKDKIGRDASRELADGGRQQSKDLDRGGSKDLGKRERRGSTDAGTVKSILKGKKGDVKAPADTSKKGSNADEAAEVSAGESEGGN